MRDAKQNRIRVVVIKDGEPKELYNLPNDVLAQLEEAYEKTPIRGLSQQTYVSMAKFFASKLETYEEELGKLDDSLFSRSVAFARAFDISYDESPIFFEMMLQIERRDAEMKSFTSKDISIKNLKNMVDRTWGEANRDFRQWSRRLFEDTGLKIGVIRMTKFFYGIITQMA